MRYSKEQEKFYISQIRRILIMRPEASSREIVETLEKLKNPIKLNWKYVLKLVKKIRNERTKRFNNYTVNVILSKFHDEVEELKGRLWNIINNPMTENKDKVAAIKEIRNSSKDLFDKIFDSGALERNLGKLIQEKVLSDEDKELLKKALKHGSGDNTKDSGEPAVSEGAGKE